MAVLKIPQSELKANVGEATSIGCSFTNEFSKSLWSSYWWSRKTSSRKLQKNKKILNDQITLNEMVRDAIVKMEKVRSEVSRNSDLNFAVNEYDKKTR